MVCVFFYEYDACVSGDALCKVTNAMNIINFAMILFVFFGSTMNIFFSLN